MTFEDELRSDLGDIQVPEALAPRADLADTVLAGMRRQTRRRMSVAAGSLAVALAVAGATAPVWLSRRPSSGPAAPTQTAPTGQVCVGGVLPTRPPSPTREYFDPLASEINASGVTGYRLTASGTATHFQVVDMVNQAGDRAVGMVLYSAGGQPHYLDDNDVPVPFDPGAGEPAGSVGGAPAYWLPEKRYNLFNTRPQGIAWQWAPDAWAVVLAEHVIPGRDPSRTPDPATVDRAELRTIATQVAPQFKLGVPTPVTSPFSVRQPDCTRVVLTVRSYATTDNGEPYTGFLVGFDTADRAELTSPPLEEEWQPSLLVAADTADAGALPSNVGGLTEFPEDLGHPAYFDAAEGRVLHVYGVSGFAVSVFPSGMPNTDTVAEKVSLVGAIFRSITIHPGAAGSEAAWGDPIVP